MNAKKTIHRILSVALILLLVLSLAACSGVKASNPPEKAAEAPAPEAEAVKAPKYVFLFIGDGMGYPQVQAAADYLGAIADDSYVKALPSVKYDKREGVVLGGPVALNFMDFEVAGTAVTYDFCSFAPDSASTATSIATGTKLFGMINVDITGSKSYETIAEKLSQKGWKVNHQLRQHEPRNACAFYAHQAATTIVNRRRNGLRLEFFPAADSRESPDPTKTRPVS